MEDAQLIARILTADDRHGNDRRAGLESEPGEAPADPVAKADLDTRSTELFTRAVEIGVAATSNFPTEAEAFLYLSMAQVEVGEFTASDANFKTYQELSGGTP